MSAMSASSPPAGLMPLSLISEHKTSVPAVQPIPRTPEKMNQQPPNAIQQQVQQPLGMKLPAGVANGMEAPQPPVPFPHQQESAHPPASMETSGSALPPTSHLPNLPSGSKGEASGPGKTDVAAESNSTGAEATPAPAAAPELPVIPEIRLPLASGLTIMPIGLPLSQPSLPPVVPPSTAPVEAPQLPKEVPVTQVASVPPPVPEGAGTVSNVAARPTVVNQEPKLPPLERAQEKKPASVPSEAVESTPTPQAAAPAPSSLVPPPVIKDAAHAPPPAPKPAAEPTKATPAASPAQTPIPAQPAPAPAKETPAPAEQAKPAAVAAQPTAATPTPVTAPAAHEAPSSLPAQPAASQAAPETTAVAQSKPKRTPKPKTTPDSEKKTPVKETTDKDGDGKPRRKRLPTQPYQSPIPELNLIAKINKIDKIPAKPQEDKLIVFYRNEFLAVRNPEGSFYVCQAMQNIYKSSSKIKIRWLSQGPNGENYSPDFYDHTEFDCILTNLNLQRVGKNQFKLPEVEAKRTDSILKRAIDVEKGIVAADESTITEEHPDGLDLSLYRNEEQLKKRKKKQKKTKDSKSDGISESSKRTKVAPEPVKKLPARGRAASKRRAVSAPPSKKPAPVSVKKASPAATPTPAAATAKKETAKKEAPATPAPKSAAKRKAPVAPASAPPADKRSRRDLTTKTKSGAASASATGSSTPKPPASSSTLRRPTRNSK